MADDTDMKKFVAEAVAAALKEALPLAAAATAQMQDTARRNASLEEVKAKLAAEERCGECGQLVKGCQRKHVRMAVYPSNFDNEWARPTEAIYLNGVKYKSTHPQELVTVPERNDFGSWLRAWVEQKHIEQNGRDHRRNSGKFLGGGRTTNPV